MWWSFNSVVECDSLWGMNEDVGRAGIILRQASIYIAGLLLVLVLDRVGVINAPRGLAEQGLSGVYIGVDKTLEVLMTPLNWLAYVSSGSKRMASLEERLSKATVDVTELQQLRQENEALKQVKGIAIDVREHEVLMVRLMDLDKGLGIDKGEADGVTEGMVVVDGQGVLVGRVSQTALHRSLVGNPKDLGVKIPVRVVGEKTLGVLAGDGVRTVLTEVLQADDLNIGDILVTTGKDGQFPGGIVVAQVVELIGGVSDTTKGAKVELLLSDEEFVYVRKE